MVVEEVSNTCVGQVKWYRSCPGRGFRLRYVFVLACFVCADQTGPRNRTLTHDGLLEPSYQQSRENCDRQANSDSLR
jgi:hypothetical protein